MPPEPRVPERRVPARMPGGTCKGGWPPGLCPWHGRPIARERRLDPDPGSSGSRTGAGCHRGRGARIGGRQAASEAQRFRGRLRRPGPAGVGRVRVRRVGNVPDRRAREGPQGWIVRVGASSVRPLGCGRNQAWMRNACSASNPSASHPSKSRPVPQIAGLAPGASEVAKP